MTGIDFNTKGYVSFMNERTVEYLLLPKLINILKEHYAIVIPFYYWITREGGQLTGKRFEGKEFNIISFYPRRPKVNSKDNEHIIFKINQELFEKSTILIPKGIPVLTGVPLIHTIVDIAESSKTYWTALSSIGSEVIVKLDIDSPDDLKNPLFVGSLNLDAQTTLKRAKKMDWFSFQKILEEVRYNAPMRSFFGGAYKPIYLILMNPINND
ncbi:hypothetical protein AY601_1773 [Pedobacter cryoconitis]|uniref:Uncharacterized protein n=1 Tax=Pedobacter cryoconitis TaxID=188932 RepID=A0A127VBL4_9SPHI|nr:hypothetical protein [Pedobacter cryoconitis]AMP98685.1 hypothetical protein AY601_1773 [Pedobacter cryoconitis]